MEARLLPTILFLFTAVTLSAQNGVFQWQTPSPPAAVPCHTPAVLLSARAQGACGPANRPAIVVQCTNCEGENWNFSVEVRAPGEDWRPLRPDGLPQATLGNAERVEPMCELPPDTYYVRVQAWGVTCTSRVTRLLGEPVVVDPAGAKAFAYAEASTSSAPPPDSETCKVTGRAVLSGSIIRGWLKLEAQSPCRELNPYALLTYSHPEHRDLTIENVPLEAGVEVPFRFELDTRDLARSLHPIEVTVYSGTSITDRQVPLASYWLNAGIEELTAATAPRAAPAAPSPPPSATSASEPMLEETFDTIGVTASDPNCNGIQDLRIFYHPVSPDDPNYLSWLSPRCCQETGCEYAVWVGSDPDRVRLLVRGTKPGAIIREVLHGVLPGDRYFEVEVETSNGVRKAAFVVGEGPIYGLDAVIAYRDQHRQDPPDSDSLVFMKTPVRSATSARSNAFPEQRYEPSPSTAQYEASTGLWTTPGTSAVPTIGNETSSIKTENAEVFRLEAPRIPLTGFTPCRYDRELTVVADQQIQTGDQVTIKYDHSREGYRYTLYFLPQGSDEWVLAPGTSELQSAPVFRLQARPYHSGSYLILTYKPEKKWGCLSSPLDAPVKLDVVN